MAKKAEQITRHSSVGGRRQLKKDAKRARRRAERRDPENAPRSLREVIRGWGD
jgi:hypothetical protein